MFPRLLPPPATSFFLLGARGTGKTTWIQEHFSNATKYDLLRGSESLRLARDPGLLTAECAALPDGAWIVLDEVRRVPQLLDEVQGVRLPLLEGLSERIGQEADEDVSAHAILTLVPDGTNRQVGFLNAEGGLRLGELEISSPKVFLGPAGDVRAQQVAPSAAFRPKLPSLVSAVTLCRCSNVTPVRPSSVTMEFRKSLWASRSTG